jgi:hypothetical protein
MTDPNPLVKLVQLEAIARDKRSPPLAVSVEELMKVEPAPFEQDVNTFMSFLTGRLQPPVQRLKNWCCQNHFQINHDDRIITIR